MSLPISSKTMIFSLFLFIEVLVLLNTVSFLIVESLIHRHGSRKTFFIGGTGGLAFFIFKGVPVHIFGAPKNLTCAFFFS